MVLANGFISKTIDDVIREIRQRINGNDVKLIPLPYAAETMTYYISDVGEVFGSQRYKNFYLTKPIKIENRYKAGCSIRIACGNKKYKNEWMQNLMHWTWVANKYIEEVELTFKDGCQYNYQLDNLQVATPKKNTTLHNNMIGLQEVYKSHFLDVAWYVRLVNMKISLDDAKDIASDTFVELCNCKYPYKADFFVGLWKFQVKKRAFDFVKFHSRFSNVVFDDGEEILSSAQETIEIVDYSQCLNGKKTHKTMELWLQGETPTEIAKIMRVSLGTVSSCITRSIQTLKHVYKKDIEYD